ncbi:MAG: MBL fold metallo-hydrolase [Thermoleophilia bacterium]
MQVLCIPVGPLQANSYVVADDEGTALWVDPGGEPERLTQVIEQRGLRLSHILLTHGHFDHLAGTAGLAKATGAQVACSLPVQPMLREPERFLLFPGYGEVPGYEADIILAEGDRIDAGDLGVTVIETPGHGPGDLTFEVEGALFCGDLLFRHSVGRTDFPGGDFETLVASVRKLVQRYPAETVVYPGHMGPTTLGEEAAENPFLQGRI